MIRSLLRARSILTRFRPAALSVALVGAVSSLATAQAGTYSQVIVFGDSLSDVGNFAHVTQDDYDVSYPGSEFNYSDHRFTDSSDTTPASTSYAGVWHEQLTRRFLGMTPATNSLDGGLDYAYGDAETLDGTRTVALPGGQSVVIENMGQQVTQFLTEANSVADSNALYIVWGGANDLFADYTDANVQATATRIAALVDRLASVGARTFIVPNLPPLGDTPEYNTDATVSANLNTASMNYKGYLSTALASEISSLSSRGITVTIAQLDVYSLFQNLIANYADFGFTDVRNSAQGESVNPDQSLFWDDVHPTTAGHNQIAQFAADILPGGHPAFFSGEAILDKGDFAYLAFPDGKEFGYYTYQFYPYLYQTDLGFEYVIPSTGTDDGVYLYDFKLSQFLYTTPTLYPYLYDFGANSFYYYFTGTTAPRVFYDFATKQYVYSN